MSEDYLLNARMDINMTDRRLQDYADSIVYTHTMAKMFKILR